MDSLTDDDPPQPTPGGPASPSHGGTPGVRVPPRNFEAEKALIGAVLANNKAHEQVSEFLRPEHFADPVNGLVFDAVSRLIERGQIADPVTLRTHFESNRQLAEVGGTRYLAELAESAVTIINAGEYGRIVYDLHLKRQLIDLGEQVVNAAFDADVDDNAQHQIETAEQRLYDLATTGEIEGGFKPFRESVLGALTAAEAAHKRSSGLAGIATKLRDLDKMLGGLHRSDLVVLAGRPSMGKAQPLDARLKTVDGWKLMGDIRVGDELASIDGRRSVVSGVFPQGPKQIVRIAFSDGRSTECCEEHLWKVHYRSWDRPRVLTTADIGRMLQRKRYQGRLWIDACSGHFGHDRPLPMDPWLLGALLGDGCLKGGGLRFSTKSTAVLEQVRQAAGSDISVSHIGHYDYRPTQSQGHRRPGHKGVWPNPLKQTLTELGLWDVGSEDTFIPEVFMTANRDARLALLRGLLDTDGWVERWGTVRFASASERLAEDTVALARSLGAWCTRKPRQTSYTHNGERRVGRLSYVCNIHHPFPRQLFGEPGKKARARPAKRRKHPVIVSIEPTRVAEAQCISVTHPHRLYITDDFVVTHNTALATNIAYNAAYDHVRSNGEEGAVVGFFSLEMSAEQLAARIISQEVQISSDRMRKGELSNDEFTRLVSASQALYRLPFYIDDTPALTVAALRTRARRLKRQHGLQLIIVDYLQLISGSNRRNENRVQELSEITRGLKTLAKELDLPVIALSQLSRAVEQREPPRPQLSDLRESGSIEQDADVVMFIYRPEYYLERKKPDHDNPEKVAKWEERLERTRNLAEVIVGKQRHGPVGTVTLQFNGQFTRFGDLDTLHGGHDGG